MGVVERYVSADCRERMRVMLRRRSESFGELGVSEREAEAAASAWTRGRVDVAAAC